MYHYYVRYSTFQGKNIIGIGWTVIELLEEIKDRSQIKKVIKMIEERLETDIIIDFYQLLRKDPD